MSYKWRREMKRLQTLIIVLLVIGVFAYNNEPAFAAGDTGTTGEVSAEAGTGQPGAAEAVQWDLTQDLSYRYDNDIALLTSDAISIYAQNLKYEDTDDGRALKLAMRVVNLTEKELELNVNSISGRVAVSGGRSIKAGGEIRNALTGADYSWNGLIGETADCYQGTYQLEVTLDGETLDKVQFDLYVSETSPFYNIQTISSAVVPEDIRRPYIEETVLADEELFGITANRLEGSTLYVTFENRSDKTLEFTSVSKDGMVNTVNGYSTNTGTYEKVGPGESMRSNINFGSGTGMCVEKIADIQHGFEVRDEETYELIANVPVHLQTSAADYDYSGESFQKVVQDQERMERSKMTLNWFTDQVDYDCAGIRILSAALISRNDKEPELYLELENVTDENLYFYTKAVAVNGLYISASIEGILVPAGKKAVTGRNQVYGLVKEDVAGLFGLGDTSSLTITGATDKEINMMSSLGSQTFTLKFTEDEEAGFSYQPLEEVMNEGGVKLDKVSELMESDDGYVQYFAAVNNSGKDIRIDTAYEGNKVNGSDVWINSRSSWVLPDGATGIFSLSLDKGDLEMFGIGSIEQITNLETGIIVSDTDGNMAMQKTISINY